MYENVQGLLELGKRNGIPRDQGHIAKKYQRGDFGKKHILYIERKNRVPCHLPSHRTAVQIGRIL